MYEAWPFSPNIHESTIGFQTNYLAFDDHLRFELFPFEGQRLDHGKFDTVLFWAAEHIGPDSSEARQTYALGDVVNTLIRTARGQTILVTHDTNSPRPYSRKILLQGTHGLVRKYPEQKIHIEGRSPAHRWEDLEALQAEFEHPVWRALEERSRGAGHGGMDFIEDYRLIECLRAGTPTDMDVYDGAAVTAVSELSERSIKGGSKPMKVPDFTRGAWEQRQPLGIVGA